MLLKMNGAKLKKLDFMKYIITIPTRLHLTLISMHANGYRQNGGIGFAIDSPNIQLQIEKSDAFEIKDHRSNGLSKQEKDRLISTLKEMYASRNFKKACRITISGDAPTHMGFGSGTAVRFGAIEGFFLINEYKYTQDEIVFASKRGGVSGIGVETYFNGGFVFDLGRADKSEFAPSSAMEETKRSLPLTCKKLAMPSWKIGICIPNIMPKTEAEEKDFFQKTCPIEEVESYKVLYHSTYGVLASIMENDIEVFANAIKQIQSCKWKYAERSLYGDALVRIEDYIYKNGALAVGMTSLGSSLYFVSKDIDTLIQKASMEMPQCRWISADVNNTGRMIKQW